MSERKDPDSMTDMRRGDRVALKIQTAITGTVSRAWEDEAGRGFVAIRTAARGERVFRLADIVGHEIISRDNEVPDRIGVPT